MHSWSENCIDGVGPSHGIAYAGTQCHLFLVGNVNFAHSVKFFTFLIIKKQSVQRHFKNMQIVCSISEFSLDLAVINNFFLI